MSGIEAPSERIKIPRLRRSLCGADNGRKRGRGKAQAPNGAKDYE